MLSDSVTVRRVHIQRDLYSRGCDIWKPFTLACRQASHQQCQSVGYAGGYGVVETAETVADITCLGSSAGTYREFPYADGCTSSDPTSIFCQSRSRRLCIAEGYMGSTGVTHATSSSIATTCLREGAVTLGTTLSSLQAAKPSETRCDNAGAISGNGCQHNAHRWCRSQGYGTGFGPVEYNSLNGAAIVICTPAGFEWADLWRPADMPGYARAAVLGDNVVGGPAYAGDVTISDGLYNHFGFPVLVRRISAFSSYVGSFYSKDSCLYLNRGAIYQFDDNDDGEVNCTYSDVAAHPSTDLLDRGLLLRPGERVIYQATPQWGSGGTGLYAWATLNITPLDGSAIPVRRVRFPKWDTAYNVSGSLYVGAGYEGMTNTPAQVPPGKPLRESNWWYPPPTATAIRGISVFVGGGGAKGQQGVHACVRVVAQGGADLRPPTCFDVRDDLFGPSSYTTAFGTAGSSFKPLDIDVPAGALIGIDYTLSSDTPTTMDFVGYVWLDQR